MSLNTAAPSYTASQVVTAAQLNALQDGIQAAWTTYTPTWAGSVTNPAIGNGTLGGRYLQVGKTITLIIQITMGSTTTYGSGNWTLTLPLSPHGERLTFIGHAFDSSAGGIVPIFATSGGTTLSLLDWPTTAGSYASTVSPTGPFAWTAGDILTLSGSYETA